MRGLPDILHSRSTGHIDQNTDLLFSILQFDHMYFMHQTSMATHFTTIRWEIACDLPEVLESRRTLRLQITRREKQHRLPRLTAWMATPGVGEASGFMEWRKSVG
jgi:hypothetical protein